MHHQGHRWALAHAVAVIPPPPVPVLVSLVPDSSGPWDQEVEINGNNFLPSSEVRVGGNIYPSTTYVSANKLKAVVRATGASGTYQVMVRNAPSNSNTLPYT
jgi:hypothetical protein